MRKYSTPANTSKSPHKMVLAFTTMLGVAEFSPVTFHAIVMQKAKKQITSPIRIPFLLLNSSGLLLLHQKNKEKQLVQSDLLGTKTLLLHWRFPNLPYFLLLLPLF